MVPDPSPQTALKQPFQTLLPAARGLGGYTEGLKAEVGKGLICYSEKGLESGLQTWLRVAAVPPHPQDFYHIYKYIHKYITYNSESGRQAPHRGSADTVTRLRNSR